MSDHLDAAFELGIQQRLALHGSDRFKLLKQSSYLDHLHDGEKSEAFGRFCAAAAVDAYERAGNTRSFGYHYFSSLEKSANWSDELQDMAVGPMLGALGLVKKAEGPLSEIAKSIGFVGGGGARMVPEILKNLYGIGALGGLALGAGTWKLDRDAAQDAPEVEAEKARADQYDKLTALLEIQARNKAQHYAKV